MSKLLPFSLGLRALQFIFGIAILGLSVDLIRGQVIGSAPVTTKYSAFVGGFGILVAAVGAASIYLEFVPVLLALALDVIAGLLYLAGGIAWAIGIRGTDRCSNAEEMLKNGLLNQGKAKQGGNVYYGVFKGDKSNKEAYNKLKSNCSKGVADLVLLFVSVSIALELLFVAWWVLKMGGKLGKKGSYV